MSADTSNAVPDDLLQRRAVALEVSAWGERFHFVQPRNLCFWIYLWLVGSGVVKLVGLYSDQVDYYGGAISVAVAICVVYTAAWWWWFRHIDRWERQPVSLILAGFIWGGLAATFALAITANGAVMSIYAKTFGQVWAADWQAGLTAPFVEETVKAAGFLLLMGLAPRLVRTVNDGLVIGAFIGLGFQVFEDVLYGTNAAARGFGVDPVGGVLSTTALRIVSGVVSHPLFTALFCAGLIYVIGTVAQPRRIGRGLLLIASSMLAHGVWDSAAALSRGKGLAVIGILLGIGVFGWIVLWLAFRLAAPREHAFVRDILGPEVSSGVLTSDEVGAVVDRHARKAYLRGHGRRSRRHLLRAAMDLCEDVAADKGEDTPRVEAARAEIARFRAAAA